MNLQDFASVAEIVGGVAVVVSLIYVGLQLKDSTSAVRSGAASDATMSMQSWYLEMGSNRQASEIWFSAMTSPEPLPTPSLAAAESRLANTPEVPVPLEGKHIAAEATRDRGPRPTTDTNSGSTRHSTV